MLVVKLLFFYQYYIHCCFPINTDLTNYYGLKGGAAIPANADLNSSVYKIPGNYYCATDATAKTLINCPLKNAFLLKVDFATGDGYPRQTFTGYSDNAMYRRTWIQSDSKWTGDVKYITTSDLGVIIAADGAAASVKNTEVEVCSITLRAGHTYLLLGSLRVSIPNDTSLMSCDIVKKNGTTSLLHIGAKTRTVMNSGGGCTTFAVASCTTDCDFAIRGYGYSSSTYDYVGKLVGIQIK